MRFSWFAAVGLLLVPSSVIFAASCSGGDKNPSTADGSADGQSADGETADGSTADAFVRDASYDVAPPPADEYCGLPGSLVFTQGTRLTIAGGAPDDISYLTLPDGYCAHHYGTVASARAIRFAPGGELFVASPSRGTAGGAPTGKGAIMVLPDDNNDGLADQALQFQNSLPSTQGMLFTPGFFYYQDETRVLRVPYTLGQRSNATVPTQVIDVTVYKPPFHWPKTIDVADDGRIYVTNGSEQTEACVSPHVFVGGVLEIDGTPNGKLVAQGFRNAQYMRCQKGHNNCFVNELTRDFSATQGGREKVVLFKDGQDFGFPCCATKDLPFPENPASDCSMVQPDTDTFRVGDTPFGLDFEPGAWMGTFKENIFVAEHGAVSTWYGARIIAIQTDPATGKPLPGTTTDAGVPGGSMRTFASGWDDDTRSHGRPADVAFSSDGRLFVANDYTGQIFWIAPLGLKVKK
jgi:glucose/arabinose dehydrogenase